MSSQGAGQRLDVVFLLNNLNIGGSERKVVRLANRLVSQGVKVGCAYLQQPDTLATELHPDIPKWFLDRRSRIPVGSLRNLANRLRAAQPTTLVGVNLYPTLCIALLGLFSSSAPRRMVCLLNTLQLERTREHWFRPLYSWSLSRMAVVVYGSQAQRAAWVTDRESGWARSCIIYNGIDLTSFAHETSLDAAKVRCDLGIPSNRFLFGSVGRLVPEKNQGVLIEAVADAELRRVDPHLLLVGEGPDRGRLEDLTRTLGVTDRVTFAGQLGNVKPALAAMDAFVLPSVSETFSNAALEAMSMSRPVLLSDVGGAPEMVTHDRDGYLLPIPTLGRDLCRHLANLARDPAKRARMGAEAYKTVVSRFSFEAMVTEYMRILSSE